MQKLSKLFFQKNQRSNILQNVSKRSFQNNQRLAFLSLAPTKNSLNFQTLLAQKIQSLLLQKTLQFRLFFSLEKRRISFWMAPKFCIKNHPFSNSVCKNFTLLKCCVSPCKKCLKIVVYNREISLFWLEKNCSWRAPTTVFFELPDL